MVNEKVLNELKKIMGVTITIANIEEGKIPTQYIWIDDHNYIDANLKTEGYSQTPGAKLINGDNFEPARPANCCRICGEKIQKYTKIYFRKINEYYGDYWLKAYNAVNGYCEKCAQAQSNLENKPPKSPKLLRDYTQHLAGDKYPTRIMEFEGFTVTSNAAYKRS